MDSVVLAIIIGAKFVLENGFEFFKIPFAVCSEDIF